MAQHTRMIFVNLPVADLQASVRYFSELGFEFNPQFTDESAAYMVVNDLAAVMLLTRERFADFSDRPICPKDQTEGLVALSAESREAVDAFVDRALSLGGRPAGSAHDYGFMYQRSFLDLDGHHWEVLYMDMDAVPKRP